MTLDRCRGRRRALPEGLTPALAASHVASVLYARGETPTLRHGADGHTSPDLALSIYAREMDRRDGEPERLRALVRGEALPLAGDHAKLARQAA